MSNSIYPSFLVLDDGSVYKGFSFYQVLRSSGEVVFNTGMTGYQEIMTDPSYSGQIIVFTYPELGNTGLNYEDCESSLIHVKGIVAKNICSFSSNWRSKVSLKDYILKKRIPHIFGLDTRSLTRHLRSKGVMQGFIVNYLENKFNIGLMKLDLVRRVTTSHVYSAKNNKLLYDSVYSYLNYKIKTYIKNTINIVLLDFGTKNNIISRLLAYGCNVYILPITSTYKTIASYKPDGIILSNGPGDPSKIFYSIQTVQKLIQYSNIPIFGICMGHQILSLALGGSTFKLKFGHRGLNHPSGLNKYSEITSQNHGFVVDQNSFKKINLLNSEIINITHFNLNDNTLGGIIHNSKPIFSVQYHPEASPGPHDSDYLFKTFINLVNITKKV
uniref:Carbamoyl phosphate synthase small chain n=1 Tax=Thuretia quercifolia TaxID=189650 RepID=A0A1Z1MJU8_9FLOR|nr:carbamoyl phosphate synthase small subunit [Thuretia quercifolia]ARW66328.1 carbamoyl phosphate synthase small subunit [Thuretia quercifolia]